MSMGCDVHARDQVFYCLNRVLAVSYCVSLQLERTALYHAVTTGHGQIALYLIRECGANLNDRDKVN